MVDNDVSPLILESCDSSPGTHNSDLNYELKDLSNSLVKVQLKNQSSFR